MLAVALPAAAQYRSTNWTAESGLPQNIVRGIAQTADGYLWIATLNGLARFDGVRFTIFDKSSTSGMTSNRFGSMRTSANGDLWLNASEAHALTRYHDGKFVTYQKDVLSITTDEQGNLWDLTSHGIEKWSPALNRFVPIHDPFGHPAYHGLRWDTAGFWAVKGRSLVCFVRGKFATYPLPRELGKSDLSSIWSAAIDEDGVVWVELVTGRRFRLTSGGGREVSAQEEQAGGFHDRQRRLWTYKVGKRLSRTLIYSASGHTEEMPLLVWFEDREQNLWIGTEGQGLFELHPQSIRVLSTAQGLPGDNIYPLLQDHTGQMWFGVWELGISRMNGKGVRTYTFADGLHDLLVTSLYEDRAQHIWAGSQGALSQLQGDRFVRYPLPLQHDYTVQVIREDSRGTLWVGTTAGLVAIAGGKQAVYTAHDGLASDDVRAIVEAPDGDLWIAGYGGLTRMRNGHFTRWTERDGLPSNNIRSLYLDGENVLWIGTYDGGIGRMADGHIRSITRKDGLFDNGAFAILEDGEHNLWFSCNRGIYRVARRDLSDFAEGKRSSVTSIAYGRADGLLNVECNGGVSPAGVRTTDGRLWFPTQEGVAVMDPAAMHQNPRPPGVAIESYAIDHLDVAGSGPILLRPGAENLTIDYTALSLIDSAQIHFRYRLQGLDSDWVDAGTRRSAYYSHLPPGRYRFQVIAANSDGVWNRRGTSVDVVVRARYFQTLWFRGLVVLCIAAIPASLWLRRAKRARERERAQRLFAGQLIASQEYERKRIASELHDAIVQRLVVIRNLGFRHLQGLESHSNLVERITEEAAIGIEETRAISYNLRPIQLDRLGLTRAVTAAIRNAAEGTVLLVHTKIDNIDDAFVEDLRINFYRIVQESFNNVLKHSGASEVEVNILREAASVYLMIRDNGHGFSSSPPRTGFGFTGMSERAQLLGGELSYDSGPSGTTITATFPVLPRHMEKHG
ncbi:two-component regulator propeller domain-containing protein [Silvibacterium sp.]|uniref:sensor histidine kinase n=1 Tax=Silvibacterium sp. TaxID=1964179 RepID=UPI0039E2CF4C